MNIKVQPLSSVHEPMIANFACGVKFIDGYLRQGFALQEENLARLFIAVNAGNKAEMVGYYAIHMMHIEARQTPTSLSRNLHMDAIVGAAYIVNFAVRQDLHGNGIGTNMLKHALKKIKTVAQEVGTWAVVLDPIDANAERFYRRLGFDTLVSATGRMYLPVAAIA